MAATTTHRLNGNLKTLRTRRGSLSVPERREIAECLHELFQEGICDDSMIRAVCDLADDPDQGVRRDAALLVRYLPEVDFWNLIERLTCDFNSFVKNAAENSLKQRHKERQEASRRRQQTIWVRSQTESLEEQFGKCATRKILRLTDRRCRLVIGSLVHNLNESVGLLHHNILKAESLVDGSKVALRQRIQKLEKQIDFLRRQIADVNMFAKPARLRYKRESLRQVIDEAVLLVTSGLREQGRNPAKVTVEVFAPGATTLEISRTHIVVALTNIIKNAIEVYTGSPTTFSKGDVVVRGAVAGENIEITVEDFGKGIPEEDLLEIGQFILGKSSKKCQGTGFGLPIAEQYVRLHGGSLIIESQEGKGTTVTIELPRNPH